MKNPDVSAKKQSKRGQHPNSRANLRKDLPSIGRPKGALNKDTVTLKVAIARFIDANHHRMQGWLDQIEEANGPAAAWDRFKDLLEYKLPKLARTEHVGGDGGPIQVVQVAFNGIQQPAIAPKPNQVETLSPLDVPILSQLDRVETSPIETTQEEYGKPNDASVCKDDSVT
jgi:hypothetical protein